MNSEEAKERLFTAAKVKLPKFDADESVGNKIGKLEDFSITAARWRASLEEARLYIDAATHLLVVRWEKLDGWEMYLPGGKRRKDATQADISAAKRTADPDLFEGLSDGKHLVSQLSSQIRRLEKDEERASRVYTFLTGN